MSDSDLWLEKAEDDLDAAGYMREGGMFSQAAFLYQQAAEKVLKAVLVEKGEGLFQSHDCFILAKKAGASEEVKEAGNSISPYYFRTRYPDADLVDLEKSEIDSVASSAEAIFEWARERL
ncbi:MAG: HEPN domain-containing protein [Candidatus Nanohaloarchaea archaeon]